MTATSETSVPRSSRPKRRWRLRAHLWRLVLIFSFLLISNRFVLSIVGVFNRFFPVIKVVFLAYPASEEISAATRISASASGRAGDRR